MEEESRVLQGPGDGPSVVKREGGQAGCVATLAEWERSMQEAGTRGTEVRDKAKKKARARGEKNAEKKDQGGTG